MSEQLALSRSDDNLEIFGFFNEIMRLACCYSLWLISTAQLGLFTSSLPPESERPAGSVAQPASGGECEAAVPGTAGLGPAACRGSRERRAQAESPRACAAARPARSLSRLWGRGLAGGCSSPRRHPLGCSRLLWSWRRVFA